MLDKKDGWLIIKASSLYNVVVVAFIVLKLTTTTMAMDAALSDETN